MINIFKKLLIFSGIINSIFLFSQKPQFNATLDNFADNREYFSRFAYSQTIFGSRVDLSACFFNKDSLHSATIGFNYMLEYGHNVFAYKPIPDVYYHYHNKHTDFYMGSFPRKNLLSYPLVLITDTLLYYRPNIQGAFGQISGKYGFVNTWIDWTSRQTDTIRETFLAGIAGKLEYSIFYFEEYLYMFHYAKSKKPLPSDNIRDNGGGASYFGLDFTKKWIFDILSFDIGAVYSYDRYRPDPFIFASGFTTRFNLLYRRIGLNAIYYNGNKQILAYGDQFYSGGKYSRIDLIAIPFKSEKVNSKFIFGIHFAADQIDFSQQLLLTIKFF
jgi:hypothetical protein